MVIEKMSIKIKHICASDNENERLFKMGLITKEQHDFRKAYLHTAYIKAIDEQTQLNELMKKFKRAS